MKTGTSKQINTTQNVGIRVHSSIEASSDGTSKEAAYCEPSNPITSGASLNHNESMKVTTNVKAGLRAAEQETEVVVCRR